MYRLRLYGVHFVGFLLLIFSPGFLISQINTPPVPESGKFRLHKLEQPIGEESYTITREGDTLTLKSEFEFTDRSTSVPLSATLRAAADYTPQSFLIQGKTSRTSRIDSNVEISAGSATIRQGKDTHTMAAPQMFFTISGYAPVAMQMVLMRYWRGHGLPPQLATLPSGEVKIRDRGPETFELNGNPVQLERYNVQGLIWGVETLWMDGNNHLAALVSTDAEFDHFEAVCDGYEAQLAKFVASAARDEMAALAELGQHLAGRRTGVFAFTGATLIDGTGRAPIPNATVVTRDGKIVAAGPGNKVKVPAGAQRIDLTGKYIIPGLWDMHAHYEQVEWGPIYLAAGITTVRDVGNEFDYISAVRDGVNSGRALGPHMLLAGVVDGDSPYAVGITRVNSPADAQLWAQRYHDAGFQQIKIYSSMKSDNVRAISRDAHQLGMTVTGHVPQGMTAYDGINDSMDQINHIHYILDLLRPADVDLQKATRPERLKILGSLDPTGPQAQQAVAFLKAHDTVLDPTMALMEFNNRPAAEPADKIEPGVDHVAPELREQLVNGGVPAQLAPDTQKIVQEELVLIGELHRAGVRIVAGTDQTVPGYSLYREIELYVKAGFTPMEALQAATIVPARVMHVDHDSGTVEPGKRADLTILDANPLQNIHNIRSVHQVVANGVLYDSAPLWESVGFTP